MEKQLEAQMSTMLEYPVARKRGKIYRGFFKGRPNFKKLSEGNRLILLIGLEDSKKIRNLVVRKKVWLVDYSAIAAEVQADEAIEDWQTFQLETNNLFYRRVKSALSKGIAVVDRNFRNLEIRLGFLEASNRCFLWIGSYYKRIPTCSNKLQKACCRSEWTKSTLSKSMVACAHVTKSFFNEKFIDIL